jgi:hypothetical protein
MGLSEIAEEFKRLDRQRRRGGLSLGDAGRYHALFERLSDALESGQRQRRVDTRQFLRVPFRMTLSIRRPAGVVTAVCHDFGGGGCAIGCDVPLALDDDVWLDGAELEGERHPLRGRASVAWSRLATPGQPPGYGLRFCLDAPEERAQIDRLFFRVLDRFLQQ